MKAEKFRMVVICVAALVAFCCGICVAEESSAVKNIPGEVLLLNAADDVAAWNTKAIGGNSVEVASEKDLVKEGSAAIRWKCVGFERERFGFALDEGARDLSGLDQIQFWCYSAKQTAASVRPVIKAAKTEYRASLRINWEGWRLITIPMNRFGDDGSWADVPDVGKDVKWADVKSFGFEEHTFREMGFFPLTDTDLVIDAVTASKKILTGTLKNEIGTQEGPFVYVARIRNLSDKPRTCTLSYIQQRKTLPSEAIGVKITPTTLEIAPGAEATAEVTFSVPAGLMNDPLQLRHLIVSIYPTLTGQTIPQMEFRVPAQRFYFDSLKLAHPRVLLNPEKIAALKELITTDERAAKMWEKVLKNADKRLTGTPGERGDRREQLFPAVQLAFAYLMTGEKKYAEKAREYVEYALKWKYFTNNPRREWPRTSNLSTGHNTMNMGLAYDWLYDFWTPEERDVILKNIVEKGLAAHYGDCRTRYAWGHPYSSNWTAVVSGGTGVGAMAVLGDEPDGSKYAEFGTQRMEWVVEAQGLDGGSWEGTSYWNYNQRYSDFFADALRTTTGGKINLFAVQPFYYKTCYFYLGTIMPEGYWANFSDAWHAGILWGPKPSPDMSPHLLRMASEFKDGYLQWKAQNSKVNLFSLLWYDPSVKPVETETRPLAQLHRGPDYAILRASNGDTDAVGLAMKAGNNSEGHCHFDVLSFIVSGYGYQLAADYLPSKYNSGYFGFQRDQNKRAATFGHNCILIDGQGQTWGREVNSDFTEFFHSEAADYIQADGSKMYSSELLSKWKRNVLFVRPRYFVMWDEIASPKPVEYQWRMMTWSEERDRPQVTKHGAIATSCAYPKFKDKAAQLKVAHTSWPVRRTTLIDRFSFDSEVDRWSSTKRRNFFIKTITNEKTDKWTLLTMLFPVDRADSEGRGEFEPIHADGVIGAKISDTKSITGPDTVLVNLGDGPVKAGDIAFTGKAALVSGEKTPQRYVLILGTELTRGDVILVSADKPVTAAITLDNGTLVGSIEAKEETTVTLYTCSARSFRLKINGKRIDVKTPEGPTAPLRLKVPASTTPEFLARQHDTIGEQTYE